MSNRSVVPELRVRTCKGLQDKYESGQWMINRIRHKKIYISATQSNLFWNFSSICLSFFFLNWIVLSLCYLYVTKMKKPETKKPHTVHRHVQPVLMDNK